MIETTGRTMHTRTTERRGEKRHAVKNGTYFDWEEWPKSFQEMDIFRTNEGYCLHNLPGDTISDCAATSYMQDFTSIGMRRRGVHFRELSPAQVEELLEFIHTHSTGLK